MPKIFDPNAVIKWEFSKDDSQFKFEDCTIQENSTKQQSIYNAHHPDTGELIFSIMVDHSVVWHPNIKDRQLLEFTDFIRQFVAEEDDKHKLINYRIALVYCMEVMKKMAKEFTIKGEIKELYDSSVERGEDVFR